jgi:hypothetical protein
MQLPEDGGAGMKYRKKPVVIEAFQTDKELDIETLEGTMHASVGDYIITGVRGEKYPCKPDIFEQTYEPADVPTASPWHRVEEPPTQEGKYLVCDELNNFYVVWWGPILGWCYDPKRFRYWMPIEPPKEDA